ncbi:DUF6933 domain-containing protein [Crenothrix sp.]|uniref:DUF6933 domain-containing protein n=1 Tax=Crenothrix sp. TaxID=3100433 RepID=UPI00374DF82F
MLLIKCIGKLQKEIEVIKSDLLIEESNDSLLGDWHANLIYIDRKKCIFFVIDYCFPIDLLRNLYGFEKINYF